MDQAVSDTIPLYRRLLGSEYDRLPPQIRAMHDFHGRLEAVGRARIERGESWFCRLLAGLLGLPKAGDNVAFALVLENNREREVWHCNFSGVKLLSAHEVGRGKDAGLLIERFGPFSCPVHVPVVPNGLNHELRGIRLFGVPLPHFLWPRMLAGESVVDGQFVFDMTFDLPFFGRLIRFRGSVTPTVANCDPAS